MGKKNDVPCMVPKPGAVSVQMNWQQVTHHLERDSDDLRKPQKGQKLWKVRSLLPAFWVEKEAPHTNGVSWKLPRCEGQGDDGVRRYASSVVLAAYVDKAKIYLASPGTAANFALASQGTIWTANSHWEAEEGPGRACSSSTVLPFTALVAPRLAGGKLT